MGFDMKKEVSGIVASVMEDYKRDKYINEQTVFDQPDKGKIVSIISRLFRVLYPGHYRDKGYRSYDQLSIVPSIIEDVLYNLRKQIAMVIKYTHAARGADERFIEAEAARLACEFGKRLTYVRDCAETDLEASYNGDPAAFSKDEIILSYPGFYATTIYRLAHELYELKVPMIPRIMTEHAHTITGIDIHPGAKIGKYFFIDHGTGIVIGSTTVIGKYVKIYQGVTLGAISTRAGQLLKGKKRHPTIEDNVTVYSGASILGGDTVVGEGSVIGGNAFVTESVPKNSRILMKPLIKCV